MEQRKSVTEQVSDIQNESPFKDLTLSDVLWPLVSFAILTVLVIFVYIPFGFEIPTFMSENQNLQSDLDKRKEKYSKLSAINQADLAEADKLLAAALPARFDVSVLANSISTTAKTNDLKSNDFTLQDEPAVGFQQVVEGEGEAKGLRSITGVFSFRGDLGNVNKFMKEIVTSEKLLVIEEFELQKVPIVNNQGRFQGHQWNVDMTIKAYSFVPLTTVNIEEPALSLPNLEEIREITLNQSASDTQ